MITPRWGNNTPIRINSAPISTNGVSTSSAIVIAAPTARSVVGDYNSFSGALGYRNGQLLSRPFFDRNKSADMTEQVVYLPYKCMAIIAGTEHVPTIVITATVNPSLLWEGEFHRLVAIYGNLADKSGDTNRVTKADIEAGVDSYIGQHQERLCGVVAKKSLKDMLADASGGFADELNGLIEADTRSPFKVKVQTTKIVLPEELLRALALKAVEKLVTPPPAKKSTQPKAQAPSDPCMAACAAQKAAAHSNNGIEFSASSKACVLKGMQSTCG